MDCLRMYVGSLPYAAQRRDVEKLFSDNSIAIKGIDIAIDPFTGRNPGYCFIDFVSEDHVAEALRVIDGQSLRGRQVKAKLATPNRRRKPARLSASSHFGSNNSSPFVFNRWLEYDTNETWTAPVDEGRRLYVGGMPRLPSQAKLNVDMRELFKNYNVQAVSKMISPHPSTNSKPGDHHYCFVDFATVYDADQAQIALNDRATPYGGRYRVQKSMKLPSKLLREQLGGAWPGGEQMLHERNVDKSWRRTEPLLQWSTYTQNQQSKH